jgi:hypothetical protein
MNGSFCLSLLLTFLLWLVKPIHLKLVWVIGWKGAATTTRWLSKHYMPCLLTVIAVEVTLILVKIATR